MRNAVALSLLGWWTLGAASNTLWYSDSPWTVAGEPDHHHPAGQLVTLRLVPAK